MRRYDLADKAVLLICCIAVSLIRPLAIWHVVPVLAAVIAAGLVTFFEDTWQKFVIFVLFAVACLLYPPLYAYIPIMTYSAYDFRRWYHSGVFVMLFAAGFNAAQPIWHATKVMRRRVFTICQPLQRIACP